MVLGIAAWMTKRTFERSMPIPNATVATTMSISSAANASCVALRAAFSMPAWYGAAR